MSNSVSAAPVASQYSVAVLRQQQNVERKQGEQSVQLIQAASPNVPPPGTGSVVNLKA
jgi:hypothetical protein